MVAVKKSCCLRATVHYLNHANCIGLMRQGITDMEDSGCAVLLSNSNAGNKTIEIGRQYAGKQFIDYLQHHVQY